MNQLHVGFKRTIEPLREGCLFIPDEIPDIKGAKVFDPRIHSFNPLKGMDYLKARQISDVLYAVYPQGESTLTVRNGKRALLKALLEADRLDRVHGDEEVEGLMGDILASPLLRRVLCSRADFSFKTSWRAVTLARINRAELGEFDALVLGLFLIGHFKGQVIVPDFGFYGRDAHASLIRQERLIAGVNFLDELSPKLRRSALLIKDKVASGATFEDAETLAVYMSRFERGTEGYGAYVRQAMA